MNLVGDGWLIEKEQTKEDNINAMWRFSDHHDIGLLNYIRVFNDKIYLWTDYANSQQKKRKKNNL